MIPVALDFDGLSCALDPAVGTWRISVTGSSYTLRPWTWGERERLVLASARSGHFNKASFQKALLQLLYDPCPPDILKPLFAFTALRLLDVPEDVLVRPLARLTEELVERFHWTPGMLAGEVAGDLDRLLHDPASAPLSTDMAPPKGVGWTSIRFDAPEEAIPGKNDSAVQQSLLDEQGRLHAALERMLRTIARWAGFGEDTDPAFAETPAECPVAQPATGSDQDRWQPGLPAASERSSFDTGHPPNPSHVPATAHEMQAPAAATTSRAFPAPDSRQPERIVARINLAKTTSANTSNRRIQPVAGKPFGDSKPFPRVARAPDMPATAAAGASPSASAKSDDVTPSKVRNPGSRIGTAFGTVGLAHPLPQQLDRSEQSHAIAGPAISAAIANLVATQRAPDSANPNAPWIGSDTARKNNSGGSNGPLTLVSVNGSDDQTTHSVATPAPAAQKPSWDYTASQRSDPFADSTLEEAMADALERAAREAGVDLI